MIFPAISKFNAKLVKKLKLLCMRQCQMSFLSAPWQVPYLFGYKTGVSPLQNDYK